VASLSCLRLAIVIAFVGLLEIAQVVGVVNWCLWIYMT
jgi:hypothetical protein